MNAVENTATPERPWTSTRPPPKPLRPELAALKAKLEQFRLEPNNSPDTSSSGSGRLVPPDSGENANSAEPRHTSVAPTTQPLAEVVSPDTSGFQPANPVAPKKKPHITKFSLTAPEQAASLPDGRSNWTAPVPTWIRFASPNWG